MEPVTALAGLLGPGLIGSISPGPSFVLVARTAVARSRRDGIAAALGMGMGAVVFTTLVLLGLTAALARVPLLFTGAKLLGGLWLLLLAWRLWQGAAAPLALAGGGMDHPDPAASFRTGLTTQVTNPKTAIYYGSVFAALLPQASARLAGPGSTPARIPYGGGLVHAGRFPVLVGKPTCRLPSRETLGGSDGECRHGAARAKAGCGLDLERP